ncbi:MAG TPA: aldo/keto reductase [Leptolyngbyaceae cyanobacterium]
MRYSLFGRTNRYVSKVAFGTWGFDTSLWRDGNKHQFDTALDVALELGINLFDTALVYGNGEAERTLGLAIASHRAGVDALVASKIPSLVPINIYSSHIHANEAFPRDHIRQCTERSLKNLGVERLFLQQLHFWTSRWLYEGDWLETLLALREEGKIEAIGVSLHDHDCFSAIELAESGLVDSIQAQFNLFDQGVNRYLGEVCLRTGTALLGRSPLYAGALAGNYTHGHSFLPGDWRESFFDQEHINEVVSRVTEIREHFSLSPEKLADFALCFCISNPFLTSVLVGMRVPRHVYSAISTSKKPLMEESMRFACRVYDWLSS